jgi:hypothetical protein
MISFPPIENGFDHKQAKALDLVDGNRRRHGEFLAAHDPAFAVFNRGLKLQIF